MENIDSNEDSSITSFSAGGVVLGDHGTIVLVQSKYGSDAWLFPKGHLEEDESDEEAARREIQEETGLTNLEYLDDLGSYTRNPINKDGSPRLHEIKHIHMFLFAALPGAELMPETTEEIGAAKWFSYRELGAVIGNEKDRVWFASVFDRVREAIQRD